MLGSLLSLIFIAKVFANQNIIPELLPYFCIEHLSSLKQNPEHLNFINNHCINFVYPVHYWEMFFQLDYNVPFSETEVDILNFVPQSRRAILTYMNHLKSHKLYIFSIKNKSHEILDILKQNSWQDVVIKQSIKNSLNEESTDNFLSIVYSFGTCSIPLMNLNLQNLNLEKYEGVRGNRIVWFSNLNGDYSRKNPDNLVVSTIEDILEITNWNKMLNQETVFKNIPLLQIKEVCLEAWEKVKDNSFIQSSTGIIFTKGCNFESGIEYTFFDAFLIK